MFLRAGTSANRHTSIWADVKNNNNNNNNINKVKIIKTFDNVQSNFEVRLYNFG